MSQREPFLLPVSLSDDLAHVQWLFCGDTPFLAPFFDETLSLLRHLPENQPRPWPVTPTAHLAIVAQQTALPPAAIIFHVSRCGSTLLSQLLSQFSCNIVLSEVPFLDQVLRKTRLAGRTVPEVLTLLQQAIATYTRIRTGEESHAFIKTDSWHISFYRYYRFLYPLTPSILLFRNPAEVLASQQKRKGLHAVPGLVEAELFGLIQEEAVHLQQDVYMARVLESYFRAMIDIVKNDENIILINYKTGALNMMQQLSAAAALTFSSEEWQQIEARAGFHAKYPGQAFIPDAAAPVPDFLVPAMELYQQLDLERISRIAPK